MNDRISIKQAVAQSGLSENYIRKAIAKGEILVSKEFIGESRIPKNWIDADQFATWQEAKAAHTKREDGRSKYVIYMTADEEAQLAKLAEKLPFVETVARANKVKQLAEEVEAE